MDLHYKQEVTVGALVLTAVALFIFGTMWMSGRSIGGGGNDVLVQFADVGNLKRGNPVRISGVQMGTVDDIRFEGVGRVIVTLVLDKQIVAKSDAAAWISSIGLVGDMVVRFDPGAAAEPLAAGAVLVGSSDQGMMAMGEGLAEQAGNVMSGLESIQYQQLSEDLRLTLVSIRRLAETFAERDAGPTGELVETMQALQQLTLRLDSVVAGPGLGQSLTNLDTVAVKLGRLTDQYASAGARLDSLLAMMQRGEGTLGRVATDTTLYANLNGLSTSLKAFIDDLRKNPGKITVQVKIF